MSAYDNVIAGKLKLKGKALDVKAAGGMKKKKKHKKQYDHLSQSTGGNIRLSPDYTEEDSDGMNIEKGSGQGPKNGYDDHLTPAERRYLEQWEKINLKRLEQAARKSHRERIHEFNQYLANLSEHYDIPKVGPG